jgi:methanogenic corrinoid protein MtbC1
LLSRAIEDHVIPKLILAHPESLASFNIHAERVTPIQPAQLREFAKVVIGSDIAAAQERIKKFQSGGMTVPSVYLDLLAPAARELGTLWEEDLCDFTDVTIGLGRLQQLLRELSPEFHSSIKRTSAGRRLLLLPCPGESHTFGLAMVAEIFRHADWDVSGGPGVARELPVVMAATEWFDVVGFSLATDLHIDELRDCIADIRKTSLNPHVGVMVGGPIFAIHPHYGASLGADVATADGRAAPELAAKLVAQFVKNCV